MPPSSSITTEIAGVPVQVIQIEKMRGRPLEDQAMPASPASILFPKLRALRCRKLFRPVEHTGCLAGLIRIRGYF